MFLMIGIVAGLIILGLLLVFTGMYLMVCRENRGEGFLSFKNWAASMWQLTKMIPGWIKGFPGTCVKAFTVFKYRLVAKFNVLIGRKMYVACEEEMIRNYMNIPHCKLADIMCHMTLVLDMYIDVYGQGLADNIMTKIPEIVMAPEVKKANRGKKVAKKGTEWKIKNKKVVKK